MAALLPIGGIIFHWTTTQPTKPTEEVYSTEVGATRMVPLTDGSTMRLNTDSEVRVEYSSASRDVELVRGEAFISVAPGDKRPFRARTGGATFHTNSAHFSLRNRVGELAGTRVVVAHGKVTLQPQGTAEQGSIALAEHTEASIKPGKVRLRHLTPEQETRQLFWQVGMLAFQGETLAEAAAEINLYHKRKVLISDSSIARLPVAGAFRTQDQHGFVSAVALAFDLRVTSPANGSDEIWLAPDKKTPR